MNKKNIVQKYLYPGPRGQSKLYLCCWR